MQLLLGDCLDELLITPPDSVDAVVTDPPYGLKFMNKGWDYSVPSTEIWKEVFRVLKPGGHVLSFGGTRTYHHMAMNIELAGFEIRDQLQWIYGSGFPKSHNLEGDYEGLGTALKPANEPIVLARKPLEKGLTVAENVLKWGTGVLNVDASRIETSDNLNGGTYSASKNYSEKSNSLSGKVTRKPGQFVQPNGRWPANVLFDEAAAEMLDAQSGTLKPAGNKDQASRFKKTSGGSFSTNYNNQVSIKTESGGESVQERTEQGA